MRTAITLVVCAIAFAACSRQDEKAAASAAPVAAPAPTGPHADFIPTQAELDRFVAEGPDPTLRKISAVDYYLHYKLMQATGIEKELGGEEKAVAALKALGEEYERRMRAAQVELPKMIKATAFTGEGMSSGFMGMGMGTFLGFMGSGLGTAIAGNMSDAELIELNKKGGIKHGNDSGSAQFTFDKDGSMTQSMEFEVNEKGLNGKVKMKTRMSACPDADGKVTVDIDVDSQMSVSGKPGTGGFVHSTLKYERYLDDDAHLIDTADGGAFSHHIKMGGFENFQSQSFEVTTGRARGGKPIYVANDESGYSIFRMEEVQNAFKLIQAADFLQTIVAESMLRGIPLSNSPWESGRCIDLKVTSDPSKRKGIRPSTAFDLEAIPRVKSDGSAAGGTVTATLNGGSSLQPASGKVKADAKYGYTGPEKKNETASIDFESRSKRGVGKASLAFDTKSGRPYRMEGGAGDFHGVGTACDLEQPFTVAGGGNTVSFVPSSRDGGTYTYAGNMSGFAVHGNGTYTVKYADDVAVKIVAQGPGTVETPVGPQTGEGTENYTLTPLAEGEECKTP